MQIASPVSIAGTKGRAMKRTALLWTLVLSLGAMSARAQHIVQVSWTASSDAAGNPSLAYNVYRAGSCAGQFTKLNSAPLSGTSYSDTHVAIGAVYCYQVTAILDGVESIPSNQTIAAVPSLPDRQSVCRHRGPLIGWIRCQVVQPKKPDRMSPTQ